MKAIIDAQGHSIKPESKPRIRDPVVVNEEKTPPWKWRFVQEVQGKTHWERLGIRIDSSEITSCQDSRLTFSHKLWIWWLLWRSDRLNPLASGLSCEDSEAKSDLFGYFYRDLPPINRLKTANICTKPPPRIRDPCLLSWLETLTFAFFSTTWNEMQNLKNQGNISTWNTSLGRSLWVLFWDPNPPQTMENTTQDEGHNRCKVTTNHLRQGGLASRFASRFSTLP